MFKRYKKLKLTGIIIAALVLWCCGIYVKHHVYDTWRAQQNALRIIAKHGFPTADVTIRQPVSRFQETPGDVVEYRFEFVTKASMASSRALYPKRKLSATTAPIYYNGLYSFATSKMKQLDHITGYVVNVYKVNETLPEKEQATVVGIDWQ